MALRDLSLGKAFLSTTDFSEAWFKPSVISFTLYDLFYTVLIVASLQQVIKRQGIVQQPRTAPSKSNFPLLSFCSNCEFLTKLGNKSVWINSVTLSSVTIYSLCVVPNNSGDIVYW